MKDYTFIPNREKTKKADEKFALRKSPERFDKYYQEHVNRNKK